MQAVSHPNVNFSLGGHLAITEAIRPIPIAIQSNAIWIAGNFEKNPEQ